MSLPAFNSKGELPGGVHQASLDDMIENENELDATLQRICHLARVQAGIRKTATPTQFESMSAGYRSEIKKMYLQVLDYLSRQDGQGGAARAVESHDEIQRVR